MKVEKEASLIGCGVGLCGMISPGCKLVGVRKEEEKVHVEDGNILQISGERSKEKKDESDQWHRVESAVAASSDSFVCRRMPTWTT
ncbi:hypothetical protein PTKIN_Ptkin09bG0070100 [Pterospermum kingtungense]